MGFKLRDFVCTVCEHKFEELVSNGEVIDCPKCQGSCDQLLSLPNLDTMCFLDRNSYAEKMKKRSADHTKKEVMKEPEKFGVRKVRET